MPPRRPRYKNIRCVICASEEPSSKIIRDNNFEKLIKFFWDGLSIDAKPLDSMKHEFCEVCFLKVVEFYDTNEVLSKLEKHLRTLQKTLIRSAINGVEKLKTEGHPLLTVQKNLFEKWSTGFKSDDENDNSNEANQDEEHAVYSYLEPKEKISKHESASQNGCSKKLQPRRPSKNTSNESVEEVTISDASCVDDECKIDPSF